MLIPLYMIKNITNFLPNLDVYTLSYKGNKPCFWAFFVLWHTFITRRNDILNEHESVFYVGIGTKNRIFQKISRNRF